MKLKTKIPKVGHKNTWYPLNWIPITHTWFKWSCRTVRSHELCYFFLSRSSLYPSIFIYFLLSKEMPCKLFILFHETHAVSSSCREECWLAARTSRFSPSQPSTRAPTLWRGLFLWRKRNTLQINKLWIADSYTVCFALACEGPRSPLFSLSIALLLPAYVGLISFPSSSMIASSSAYLFWGTWLPEEPWRSSKQRKISQVQHISHCAL